MRIGIVTTWWECGAGYVSKQYAAALSAQGNQVFIYARGNGKLRDPNWNGGNVHFGKDRYAVHSALVFCKKDFLGWIRKNRIDCVIFNEQRWWPPVVWCHEIGVSALAYVDYYTEETIPLFSAYNGLLCNTHRHVSAFSWHPGCRYIPWGTDVSLFRPASESGGLVNVDGRVTFFHSCGYDMRRKGTDVLLDAMTMTTGDFDVVIHSQRDIDGCFSERKQLLRDLVEARRIKMITATVSAPGLYHLGDVYVYPSLLDGIGLSLPEALSCGLPSIVSDSAPMTEFVPPECGYGSVIKVERLFSRHDGYYWPLCLSSASDLAILMDRYAAQPDRVIQEKLNARQQAIEYLDWTKNASGLSHMIEEVMQTSSVAPSAIARVLDYDKRKRMKSDPFRNLLSILKNNLV